MGTLSTAGRNAACDGIVDLLNSGTLELQTSGDVEVATLTFAATAFGAASTGVATAGTITSDTSATGGTASKGIMKTSGAAEIASLTAGVSGSGADIIMTSLTVGAGDTVGCSAMTVTVPA